VPKLAQPFSRPQFDNEPPVGPEPQVHFPSSGWGNERPQLFAAMIKDGFDVLTYRPTAKFGVVASMRAGSFIVAPSSMGAGRTIFCTMSPVFFLKDRLRLRQVTRLLCDSGHQANVITSRWNLRDIEVAYRMFERWRQENFFKYMREEFLLDVLVDCQIEQEDPTRTIPNPERDALDKEMRVARADLAKLEREFVAAAANNAE